MKDIKKKYFTASDYKKFMNNILDAKITWKKLVNESGLNGKIKTLAKREEIKLLATKVELKAEQDKIVKLETYDLSLFIGQRYFVNDGLHLVRQPLYCLSDLIGNRTLKYRPFHEICFFVEIFSFFSLVSDFYNKQNFSKMGFNYWY